MQRIGLRLAVAMGCEAADATRQQANLWYNPEVRLMAGNVVGSSIYKGTNVAETTPGVTQRIELGGKRSSRIGAAKELSGGVGERVNAAREPIIHSHKAEITTATETQEKNDAE